MTPSDDSTPALLPYLRQSQARHDETEDSSLSLNQQEESIRSWGERNGYRVLPAVRDHDESGRTMDRPGFNALLATVKPGVTVATWKYDRFARNLIGQEQAVAELEAAGATVVSITEPPGKLPRQLMGSIAEYYSDQLSERMVAIRQASVRAGRFVGVSPGMGYHRANLETVIDRRTGEPRERRSGPIVVAPDEAAIVRELFDRVAAGESLHPITRELAARGVRTPRGLPITRVAIRQILRNPFYRGVVTYKGGQEVRGQHEAIVNDAVWFAVQERLDRHARTRERSPNPETSWAEGHVTHACGSRMYFIASQKTHASGNTSRYEDFVCRRVNGFDKCGVAHAVVRAVKVEAAIRACLAADLATVLTLDRAIARAERDAGGGNAAKRRALLAKQRERADARRARARELWLADGDDLAAWEGEQAIHRTEIARIDRELAALPVAPDAERFARAAAQLTDVALLIADMDGETVRRTIDAVGVLEVGPAGMTVRYREPFARFVAAPLILGW